MTDLRTAAQQALEAIEDSGHKADLMAAADALRAALAEPVQETVQETVMYQWEQRENGRASVVGQWFGPLYLAPYTTPPQRPAEPEERNFCPRCGKRTHTHDIHTCTPPQLWKGKEMNERIRKLAEQCVGDRPYNNSFDWEKFAQLIIRECIQVLDDCHVNIPDDADFGSDQTWVRATVNSAVNFSMGKIKEHFGVE